MSESAGVHRRPSNIDYEFQKELSSCHSGYKDMLKNPARSGGRSSLFAGCCEVAANASANALLS